MACVMYLLLEQSGLKSGQRSPVKESGAVKNKAKMISSVKNFFIARSVLLSPRLAATAKTSHLQIINITTLYKNQLNYFMSGQLQFYHYNMPELKNK